MEHSLRNRLVPVSFTDLSDCPDEPHHAIGSPHFQSDGRPKYPDPVIIAARADVVGEELPPASSLVVSATTYPIFSYGPLFERVKERANFLKFESIHRELEKKRVLGEIFTVPPAELAPQVDEIVTAVITEYGEISNRGTVELALEKISRYFSGKPFGSTVRIPPIGTGKVRLKKHIEHLDFREFSELILKYFDQTVLLPEKSSNLPPRKVLLLTPSLSEAREMAGPCVERALTLSLLDLLGIELSDTRLIFGLAYGEGERNRFFSLESWDDSIADLELALSYLTQGRTELAVQAAARAVTKDPFWSGAFKFIESIASKSDGLKSLLMENIASLAERGELQRAEKLAHISSSLYPEESTVQLYIQLRKSLLNYNWRELNFTLENLDFLKSKEKFLALESALQSPLPLDSLDGKVSDKLEDDLSDLKNFISQKSRELQRLKARKDRIFLTKTLSLAVEQIFSSYRDDNALKVLIDQLENWIQNRWLQLNEAELSFYEKFSRIVFTVSPKEFWEVVKKISPEGKTDDLDFVEILKLLARAEEVHFLLREGTLDKFSRREIAQLAESLAKVFSGLNALDWPSFLSSEDLLAQLLLVVLLSGPKSYQSASEFLTHWKKVLEKKLLDSCEELSINFDKFERKVSLSPREFPYLSEYFRSLELWGEFVGHFEHLLSNLLGGGDAESLSIVYDNAMESLKKLNRHYLIQLYQKFLGHKWLLLVAAKKEPGVKLEIPGVGEFSLDLILLVFRKLKIWWKFRGKSSKEAVALMESFIKDKLVVPSSE